MIGLSLRVTSRCSELDIDGDSCFLCFEIVQGNFGLRLFQSLNPDPKLLGELYPTQLRPPLLPPEPPLENGCRPKVPEKEVEVAHETEEVLEERLAAELEEKVEKAQPLVCFYTRCR